ncbi:MAG: tRNA pseudouridine(55) synthase TruB [Oligoflexia bacterium]|nr:tRNA pseudouridine(55) synthase TruB [Oligoflexia bacterium]
MVSANNNLSGVIVVDKPRGKSSFWAVERLRKIVNISKIGHTGTLDPIATGVLPVCIGEATKAAPFIMDGIKQYQVRAMLGARTDTFDAEGKVTETYSGGFDFLNDREINDRLQEFTGKILQLPPMFSAVKKDGVPLYKLARKGETVERKAKKIEIKNIELIRFDAPFVDFKLECSKGTYVRSLIDDLGVKLGTFAHMTELRRLATGTFTTKEAIDISGDITRDTVMRAFFPLEDVLARIMPCIEVDRELAKRISNGYQLSFRELKERLNIISGLPENGLIAVNSKNSEGKKTVLSVAKIMADDCFDLLSATGESKVLKTVRVFNYGEWH